MLICFFDSVEIGRECVKYLKNKGHSEVFSTENAVTIMVDGVKVQCVFIVGGHVEEILSSFDFTVSMFAVDKDCRLYCGDTSLFDLGNRSLRVNKITFPIASLSRMLKYFGYGFKPCTGTQAKFLRESLSVVNSDPSILERTYWYLD